MIIIIFFPLSSSRSENDVRDNDDCNVKNLPWRGLVLKSTSLFKNLKFFLYLNVLNTFFKEKAHSEHSF